MHTKPAPLGLKRSFGFGDRLGLATPGHIDAVRGTSFLPIFAQQSIRELTRTQRQPNEVMAAAVKAIKKEGWKEPWGADADHLQTKEDVIRMAEAGFTFFTIDPSAYVNNKADALVAEELDAAYRNLVEKGEVSRDEAFDLYLGKSVDLGEGAVVRFDDRLLLQRAVVKYGAALAHTKRMYEWIAEACGTRPFEVEMSVDETLTPTTPLEHLFIGLELKRLGVKLVSLAPRFVGDFEKAIDYKGDLDVFENHYKLHVAIARYCGPYKLSIHSGSDKFKIYPIAGRLSGDLLHVKTAGTSYLEALRVICRTDVPLFREIVAFCRGRYNIDKATYHVSARLDQVPEHIGDKDLEQWYLENPAGRQILHVTFGSVLTVGDSVQDGRGKVRDGVAFKEKILENLSKNDALYREVLHKHLSKHLQLLSA